MARLAFGVVGAAIGGYFGGPTGAQFGYIAGSALGGFLFPEPPVVIEGPRLGDLTVSGASYGAPIRIGYGTVKMAGNLIWAGAVRENEHREEVDGGKGGGPSQVQTTYTYFASSAFAFAAGPADEIIRLWFDNKLVYDKSAPVTDPITGTPLLASLVTAVVKKPGISFTFYPGDETQLPDPVIESEEGVGQVPGHRGLCYIVLNDLELTDYGNRFPQVSAEIAFSAQTSNSSRLADEFTTGEGGLYSSRQASDIGIDHRRRRIYTIGSGTSGGGLGVFDMNNFKEIRQILDTDIITGAYAPFSANGEISVGKSSGFIYLNSGSSNTRPILKINPNTMKEISRFGFQSTLGGPPDTFTGLNMTTEIAAIDPAPTPGTNGRKHYLMCLTVISDVGILDADAMNFLHFENTNTVRGMAAGKPSVGIATGWLLKQSAVGNSALEIIKVQIVLSAAADGTVSPGVNFDSVATIPSSTWNDDAASVFATGPVLDETDNSLLFFVASATSGTYVIKWRENDGIVWVSQVNAGTPGGIQGVTQSSFSDGLFGWVDILDDAILLDTRDGSVAEGPFDWNTIEPGINPSGFRFYDGLTQSIVTIQGSGGSSHLAQLFIGRVTGLGDSLSSIVSDLSERVGLDPLSELDVTELTDTVRGYAVTRQMTARAAVEPLQRAFFFDGAESDDKVVFKKRGRAVTRTIVDDDLIPLNAETFDVVSERRQQEVELPNRVSIAYMDVDRDYSESAQAAKRILNPTPTMFSRNEVTIVLPIVFNANEAAQIAEKTLFTSWNERTTYAWHAPWEQMDLDPGDVVNLQIDNQVVSTTLRTRIMKAVVNLDLTVSFEGTSEDAVTVVSDKVADSGQGFPQQVIPGPAFTQLFLLDIPLLRDLDDTARSSSRLYYAMQGFQPDWPGGALFDSFDGLSFGFTGLRSPIGVSHGIAINALPDTENPFLTDTTTQLQVIMSFGSLSSVTQTQFINDENAALVGNPNSGNWEIILFKDVAQQADGSYIISTLMRGRRGTDANVGSHGVSETFIVLNRDTIGAYVIDLANFNVTRYYKGVGYGSLPEDSDTETLASAMSDLKPYAPSHVDAVIDGSNNIDLSWIRRTRVGGALTGGTGTVPLSEDSEAYEVDILDAPGGSVVRTISSLTSPAAEYTKAQIITDLGVGTGSTTLSVFDGDTFTRPAGSFITDGFVPGMTIETSGFTNGANNGVFTVIQVTATNLDIVENTLIAETGNGDEQMDAIRENDITVRVYQLSTQVGRGFSDEVTITL